MYRHSLQTLFWYVSPPSRCQYGDLTNTPQDLSLLHYLRQIETSHCIPNLLVDWRTHAHRLASLLANRTKRIDTQGMATHQHDRRPRDGFDPFLGINNCPEWVFDV
jgi:hypothetical protein